MSAAEHLHLLSKGEHGRHSGSRDPFSRRMSPPLLHAFLAQQRQQHLLGGVREQQQEQRSFLAAAAAGASSVRNSVLPELLLAQHLADQSELDFLTRSRMAQLQQARGMLSARETLTAETLLRRESGADRNGHGVGSALRDSATTLLLERAHQQAVVAEEVAVERQRRSMIARMMGGNHQSMDLDAILRAGILSQHQQHQDTRRHPSALGASSQHSILAAAMRNQSRLLSQSSATTTALARALHDDEPAPDNDPQRKARAEDVASSARPTSDSARPPKKRRPVVPASLPASLPPK